MKIDYDTSDKYFIAASLRRNHFIGYNTNQHAKQERAI